DAAQLVQSGAALVRSETRQHIERFHRDKQLIVIGIQNAYTIMRRPIDIKRDQPIKLADAMLDMYHQITDIEFRGSAQSRFITALAGLACQAVAQQILFGNDDEVIGNKTVLQRQ